MKTQTRSISQRLLSLALVLTMVLCLNQSVFAVNAKLATPAFTVSTPNNTPVIEITKPVPGATHYALYRMDTSNGKYIFLKYFTKSYTDTGWKRNDGDTNYKVMAVTISNKKVTNQSALSSAKSTYGWYTYTDLTGKYVGVSVKLEWSPPGGAMSYQVQRKASNEKNYTIIAEVKDSDEEYESYTDTPKLNVNYQYRIVARTTTKNGKYYITSTVPSNVVSATVKKADQTNVRVETLTWYEEPLPKGTMATITAVGTLREKPLPNSKIVGKLVPPDKIEVTHDIVNKSYYKTKSGEYVSKKIVIIADDISVCSTYEPELPKVSGNRVVVDMENIQAGPELPTGTAIAAVASKLNCYGYNVDKMELLQYLEIKPFYSRNGQNYGYDSYNYFVGDPTTDLGYAGIRPILQMVENYFDAGYKLNGNYIVRCSIFELEDYQSVIDEGRTLTVWAKKGMKKFEIGDNIHSYIVEGDAGASIDKNAQCFEIVGYDYYNNQDILVFADPNSKNKTVDYTYEQFLESFEHMAFCVF